MTTRMDDEEAAAMQENVSFPKEEGVLRGLGDEDGVDPGIPLQITTHSINYDANNSINNNVVDLEAAPEDPDDMSIEVLRSRLQNRSLSVDNLDARSSNHQQNPETSVENLPEERPLRSRERGRSSTDTMSRASTISWADDNELYLVDGTNENGDSARRGGKRPGMTRRASLSESVSRTVENQVHHHYSALFGDDYSKKEGTFVLLAGVVLAFNMGFTNGCCVAGFLTANGESQVVAGFAGPFAQSSLAVAKTNVDAFGFHSSLILSYMFGAALAGSFTPAAKPYTLQPTYGPTFLVGGIMLFMASILAALEADPSYIFFLAACVCGLQNGIASIYSSNLIRCSMTGAITDIALTVGQLTRGNTKTLPKSIVLSLLVFFFWVGGIAAYFMSKHYLSFTLFFNAGLFWLVGVACVIFLVKNISISPCDAVFGTWAVKKTLRQLGGIEEGASQAAGEEKLKNMFDEIE